VLDVGSGEDSLIDFAHLIGMLRRISAELVGVRLDHRRASLPPSSLTRHEDR